jgi:polysaccharide deacetylase family protein (PEP-CTERM system associated)
MIRRALPPLRNALTVDVEDWFQVQAYAGTIARAEWDRLPRRVEANTDRLLALFAAAGVRATFFTLGWVAARHPGLIRRIVAAGHELASHGYGHAPVDTLDAASFRADIARARALLQDTGGAAVRGYRAPTFSLGPRTPWAWDLLAETGHADSSSVYPVRHDLYGDPGAPRTPHRRGGVWEVPMTTLRVSGRNLPAAGGGWFRLLPYRLFRAALRQVNRQQRQPALFYVHPWEIDPAQPRVAQAPVRARLRHRLNLAATEARLTRLLADFAWGRLDAVFPELSPPAR